MIKTDTPGPAFYIQRICIENAALIARKVLEVLAVRSPLFSPTVVLLYLLPVLILEKEAVRPTE
ncbi:MAG: hypothetical protein JO235_07695 [Chroococcidiopsidaceae cyanobacterium CP_BM_RX_35]|nr:hypothetical protein [Chroococcidiopsidaceae cyanobacterium CP_BM_RX_35]